MPSPSRFGLDAEDSSTRVSGLNTSPRDTAGVRQTTYSPVKSDAMQTPASSSKLYTEASLTPRSGSPVARPAAAVSTAVNSQFGLGEELGMGTDDKRKNTKQLKSKSTSSSSTSSSSSSSSSDSDGSSSKGKKLAKGIKVGGNSSPTSFGLHAETTSNRTAAYGLNADGGKQHANSSSSKGQPQNSSYGLKAEVRPGSPVYSKEPAGFGLAVESGVQPTSKQQGFGLGAGTAQLPTRGQPQQPLGNFGLEAEQKDGLGETRRQVHAHAANGRPQAGRLSNGNGAQGGSTQASRQQVLGQCGVIDLQEVTFSGRPYLLDRHTGVVYKDVVNHNVPEPVGKIVNGQLVYTPPTRETELYTAMAAYLQRKQLAFEDVFAALDTDRDGCLRVGAPGTHQQELATLMTDVLPGLLTTEVLLFSSLADFDGDGYVSLEDLQAAGAACFEVSAELELAGLSPLSSTVHQVATLLNMHRERVQLLFTTLDSSCAGWLEPAGWVRFFRALLPDLSPVQLRYVLSQVYQGPEDNRKSLSEVIRLLMEADTQLARKAAAVHPHTSPRGTIKNAKPGHASEQQACQLRAEHMAQVEPILSVLHQPGISLCSPGGPTYSEGSSPRQGCLSAAVRTLPANPRGAVSAWFQALAAYTSRTPDMPGAACLRDLLARCDANKDGYLDAAELRHLIQVVLSGVTEAQAVYIKAALNPSSSSLLSFEDVLRTVAKLSAGLAWETPAGAQAPLDALYLLSTFMRANKVKLQLLVSMFDGDGNGVLGTHDLARMLRYAQPGLSSRQVDICLAQLHQVVDQDHDGLISCQDLRLALQQRQAHLAMMRRQHAVSCSDSNGAQQGHDLTTSNPWDPFTLASLAMLSSTQGPSGPGVPLAPQSLLPTVTAKAGAAAAPAVLGNQAGSTSDYVSGVMSPGRSGHTTLTVPRGPLTAGQAGSLCTSQLDPLVYCGYTYLHDPVPNLVYLPVKVAPGSAQDGAPCTNFAGCSLSVLQCTCSLLLFGRLRPDKHVQRVETAVANALFTGLDQQLKGTHTTLDQLVARFAVQPSRAYPHASQPKLDLVGVSQLAQALIPAWAAVRGVPHYLMALFDVDGDGLVSADDIMDAFEEAGTTVDTLQTPAHVVHAKAYKLLSRLASHVVGPAAQEQATRQLFQQCDTDSKGGLTLPELARFVASLSYQAAVNQANTQQDLIGQPTAYPVQPISGMQAGNPAAAGATSDDVGALCVYVGSRIMGSTPHFTWNALLQLLRPMNVRLPTHVAEAGPLPDRPGSPSLMTSLPSAAAAPGVTVYPTNISPRPMSPGRQGTAPGPVATQTGVLGTAYCSPRQHQQGYSTSSVIPPSSAAGAQYTNSQQPCGLGLTSSMLGQVGPTANGAEALVTVRRAPLRAEAAAAPRGASQPARREVALVHHSTYSTNTPGTPQQVLLLDPHTGLLYRAPAELYQPAKPAGAPMNRPVPTQTWVPSSSPTAVMGGYKRPGSSCGAGPGMAPSLSMSYPQLVGKLEGDDHRLLPAPVPSLSAVFNTLVVAAQDAYQLQTLYKLHDKDGCGLDLHGLHQLLMACAPAAGPDKWPAQSAAGGPGHAGTGSGRRSSISTSQSDLLLAAMDVDGNGRVTWAQLTQGLTLCEQSGNQHMTTAEWRAMRVLHEAGQLLGRNLRAFWLLCTITDSRGVGHLDLDTACGLLAQLLHGMPLPDLEVVYAYIGAAHVGSTQHVTPDELLQLLHVLPLRYTGPLLNRTAPASPRSNPLAPDDASDSLLACLASDDEGVLFKPGFIPLPVLPLSDVVTQTATAAGLPGMPQYAPGSGIPTMAVQSQQAGQYQAGAGQQLQQPADTLSTGAGAGAGGAEGWDPRRYPFVYAGVSPPHHMQLCSTAPSTAGTAAAGVYPQLIGLRPQPQPWRYAPSGTQQRTGMAMQMPASGTAQFNKPPWNGTPPAYVQPPYDLQGYMQQTYHNSPHADTAQWQQGKEGFSQQQGQQALLMQTQGQQPASHYSTTNNGTPLIPPHSVATASTQQYGVPANMPMGLQASASPRQQQVQQQPQQYNSPAAQALRRSSELYDEAVAAREANTQLGYQVPAAAPRAGYGLVAEAPAAIKSAPAVTAVYGLGMESIASPAAAQYGLSSESPRAAMPSPPANTATTTYGLASEPSLSMPRPVHKPAASSTQFGLSAESSSPMTDAALRSYSAGPVQGPQGAAALSRPAAAPGQLAGSQALPVSEFKGSLKQQNLSASTTPSIKSPAKQAEFGLLGESLQTSSAGQQQFGLLGEGNTSKGVMSSGPAR